MDVKKLLTTAAVAIVAVEVWGKVRGKFLG